MKNLIVETKAGITRISYHAEVQARPQEIWDILKYPGRISEFHPLIRKSYMDSQSTKDKIRHCHLIPMGIMQEKITQWDEGKGFTTEVVGGQLLPPYTFMKGRVQIEKQENHPSVSFTFTYQLKFGILGRVMNALLIRPQFKNAPYHYITGLKKYVERFQ